VVRPGFGLELQLAHQLRGHRAGINALAFSADGKRLATVGSDGRIGLFDVATGEGAFSNQTISTDQQPNQPGSIAAVAFTPDGQSLLTADYEAKTLSRWSIQDDSPSDPITIATQTDNPLWISLSPNADEIAAVGRQQVITRHALANADTPATDGAGEPTPLVGHESERRASAGQEDINPAEGGSSRKRQADFWAL
jgi:WD40 repeat protein